MRHGAAASAATTIGFDDVALTNDWARIAKGYEGFAWRNLAAYAVTSATAGSGYDTGIVSGEQGAYAMGSAPVTMGLPRGTFTLDSVQLTAAWDTQLTVDIYGYLHGAEKYHVTVTVGDQVPTLVDLDFTRVHRVVFVTSDGVDDPALDGQGDHLVFDDLVVSDIHQRPAPVAMPAELAALA